MSVYAQYEGKKVEGKLSDEAEPFEAKVQKAKAGAVLIKRSGKSQVELHEDADFEYIRPVSVNKPVKAKRLNPVTAENVKAHLADRHGYQVNSINAMTADEAFEFHSGIDHKETDLGHFHADSKRDQAVAEAEAEQDQA